MDNQPSGASFRDPSGFMFSKGDFRYRQVNQIYQQNYDLLMSSGLYQALVDNGKLISHQEVDLSSPDPERAYKIIQPEQIDFISYPYEWSFSQLKDAALLTLQIQKKAMDYAMSLKDGSAYNIQFFHGKPVFIDTLSFEPYEEGSPWVPYRQFCQHFLAPLSLMAYRDIRLNLMLRDHIDGIPLDLASTLLPNKTRFIFPLLINLHLHASSQKRYATSTVQNSRQMNRTSLLGLIDSLETAIRRLDWSPSETDWADYYDEHNYSQEGLDYKRQIVLNFLDAYKPKDVWDLGANTGVFSRLASEQDIPTIAFDYDPGVIERIYLENRKGSKGILLPLVMDLTNPSPGIGWNNRERMSFLERGPADAVFALALIHHLAIANNLPLDRLASFFQKLCRFLLIEFVPKEDSQVKKLLATRLDIFPEYNSEHFERVFNKHFTIHKSEAIPDSSRRMYMMERR